MSCNLSEKGFNGFSSYCTVEGKPNEKKITLLQRGVSFYAYATWAFKHWTEIATVHDWPAPFTVNELRSFTGFYVWLGKDSDSTPWSSRSQFSSAPSKWETETQPQIYNRCGCLLYLQAAVIDVNEYWNWRPSLDNEVTSVCKACVAFICTLYAIWDYR